MNIEIGATYRHHDATEPASFVKVDDLRDNKVVSLPRVRRLSGLDPGGQVQGALRRRSQAGNSKRSPGTLTVQHFLRLR